MLSPGQKSRGAHFVDRLKKSAMFYGLLGTVVRVGSNILLLPLVLTYLPTSEVALWWVFLSLGALANLADFGFAPAITRVYSYLWAGAEDFDTEGLSAPSRQGTPNLDRIRELHVTVAQLYTKIAAILATFLIICGSIFLWQQVQTLTDPGRVWLAWGVYLAAVWMNVRLSYWTMAAQGINRVREVQAASLWGGLAYVGIGAAFLVGGFGLLAMAVAVAARALVSRSICAHAFRKTALKKPWNLISPDRSILKKLWPNARKFGIMSIGSYLITHGLILVGSQLLPPETTASLGLSQQVGLFTVSVGSLWLQVKWPEITILRTQGRLYEMSTLFCRRLALVFMTYLLLAVIVVVVGNELLHWKGTETRLLPTGPLAFYLIYLAFQLFYGMFGLLAMTNNVVPFHRIAIGTGFLMIVLSLIMTPIWQLWGLLLAPAIAEVAYSAWFTVRRGYQSQPFTARQLIQAALRGHA